MIHNGFLKHGMFIEGRPINTLLRYQNYKTRPSLLSRLMMMLPEAIRPAPDPAPLIKQFIQAMNDMSVRSVWLQLFNANGELDPDRKGATSRVGRCSQVGRDRSGRLGLLLQQECLD